MNYTSKTIKTIATLTFLATTSNLSAFSLLGNSQTTKECIISYEGKLNFLTELYSKNMLVSTGEQIRSVLNNMSSQSNTKIYIDARSEMMRVLIDRVNDNNTITQNELRRLIKTYKVEQQKCISNKKSDSRRSLVGGW
jgi:NAD(P)H-flavin reductase